MKLSQFQKKKKKGFSEKARDLYRLGLTTREVGKIVGRSHEWVAQQVRPIDVDNSLLTKDDSESIL